MPPSPPPPPPPPPPPLLLTAAAHTFSVWKDYSICHLPIRLTRFASRESSSCVKTVFPSRGVPFTSCLRFLFTRSQVDTRSLGKLWQHAMTAPSERATFWSSFDQINHFLYVWGLDHLLLSLSLAVAWSEIFFFFFLRLHRLSGTVSLVKLDHQTHSHLSKYLWNLTSLRCPIDSVCLSVCLFLSLCARARRSLTVFWFFVMGYVLQFGEIAHQRVTIIIILVKGRFLTRVSSMANQSPWIRCYSVSSWILMDPSTA